MANKTRFISIFIRNIIFKYKRGHIAIIVATLLALILFLLSNSKEIQIHSINIEKVSIS